MLAVIYITGFLVTLGFLGRLSERGGWGAFSIFCGCLCWFLLMPWILGLELADWYGSDRRPRVVVNVYTNGAKNEHS